MSISSDLSVPGEFPREMVDYIFTTVKTDQFGNLCSVDKRARELVRKQLMKELEPPSFHPQISLLIRNSKINSYLITHIRQDYEELTPRNKAWLLAHDLSLHADLAWGYSTAGIKNLVCALSRYHQTGLLEETFGELKQRKIILLQITKNAKNLRAVITRFIKKESGCLDDFSSLPSIEQKLNRSTKTVSDIKKKRFFNGQFFVRTEKLAKQIIFETPKLLLLGNQERNSIFSSLPIVMIHKIMMDVTF